MQATYSKLVLSACLCQDRHISILFLCGLLSLCKATKKQSFFQFFFQIVFFFSFLFLPNADIGKCMTDILRKFLPIIVHFSFWSASYKFLAITLKASRKCCFCNVIS